MRFVLSLLRTKRGNFGCVFKTAWSDQRKWRAARLRNHCFRTWMHHTWLQSDHPLMLELIKPFGFSIPSSFKSTGFHTERVTSSLYVQMLWLLSFKTSLSRKYSCVISITLHTTCFTCRPLEEERQNHQTGPQPLSLRSDRVKWTSPPPPTGIIVSLFCCDK